MDVFPTGTYGHSSKPSGTICPHRQGVQAASPTAMATSTLLESCQKS